MTGIRANGLPARVLDVLETDGGWLTQEGLVMVLGCSPATLNRTLWRLKQQGLVEHRTVELALRAPPLGSNRGATYQDRRMDTRGEWRAR